MSLTRVEVAILPASETLIGQPNDHLSIPLTFFLGSTLGWGYQALLQHLFLLVPLDSLLLLFFSSQTCFSSSLMCESGQVLVAVSSESSFCLLLLGQKTLWSSICFPDYPFSFCLVDFPSSFSRPQLYPPGSFSHPLLFLFILSQHPLPYSLDRSWPHFFTRASS